MQARAGRTLRRRAGLALALLGLLGHPSAQESVAQARAELFRSAAQRVERLMHDCQAQRLYLERDRLCEALIELDPEHAEARRTLHYRRGRNGWERATYHAPQNRGSVGLESMNERRRELAADWRRDRLALAQRFDGWLARAERDEVWDDVVILAPEDAEARAYRGEVQDPRRTPGEPARWILVETEAAQRRRAELRAFVGTPEPAPAVPIAAARESGLDWGVSLASDEAQLHGVCSPEEAHAILLRTHGVARLFRELFDERPKLPRDFTLYVLGSRPARNAFLARHPSARVRASGTGALEGAWRSHEAAASWHEDPARRLDQLARESAECMLVESFGLGERAAWVLAGFGPLLAELAAGLPRPGPGSEGSGEPEGRRSLAELLVLERAAFSPADERLALLFARFLSEAHAPRLPLLLDEIGRGRRASPIALEERLGHELSALERRFLRWVEERGEGE